PPWSTLFPYTTLFRSVAGGLAIDLGLVLLGVAPLGFGPPSHGGFATVDVVPFGCDVLPDATVELETPLALEPVLPTVEVVLLGRSEEHTSELQSLRHL